MRRAKRNTPRAGAERNTSQLEAFPASANAKLRQTDNKRAVVSIRLLGETIAWLDRHAAQSPERRKGHRRYRATRSEVIELAIAAYRKQQKGT